MAVIGLRLAEPSVGTEGKCAGDKGEVVQVQLRLSPAVMGTSRPTQTGQGFG